MGMEVTDLVLQQISVRRLSHVRTDVRPYCRAKAFFTW